MRFVYAKVKQISDIIRQIYKKYRDLANYKHLPIGEIKYAMN